MQLSNLSEAAIIRVGLTVKVWVADVDREATEEAARLAGKRVKLCDHRIGLGLAEKLRDFFIVWEIPKRRNLEPFPGSDGLGPKAGVKGPHHALADRGG